MLDVLRIFYEYGSYCLDKYASVYNAKCVV